jgi:4-alpha-glucanotransferase
MGAPQRSRRERVVNERLAQICQALGIETTYVGIDGAMHTVPEATLVALADVLQEGDGTGAPPPTIADVLAEHPPGRCFLPSRLENARVWGITCQLPGLVSTRNAGMGDFADLAALCRTAAAEGADFVGVNPLHALFWSDPERVSPFFPSNRRFLNPLYVALDWVDGYFELSEEERSVPAGLRAGSLVDRPAVARYKDRLLRILFSRFPATEKARSEFDSFRASGGEALRAHALFEAISQTMAGRGIGATPPTWPPELRRPTSASVASFTDEHCDLIDYHLWLQWEAHRQLAEVQERALDAGLKVGLYLDLAVGVAPDGSAAWAAPKLALANVSIGAPPDPFSVSGQDWGLAPLSPTRLAACDARPLAEIVAAAAKGGALRIDHAMGVARMWLIPPGFPAADGAYVRYPLRSILARLADVSHAQRTLVVGEDLGVVPEGFRQLMAASGVHGYRVLMTERDGDRFADPKQWPVDGLACIATHDMPTFTGWWHGADLDVRRALGLLGEAELARARAGRCQDREMLSACIDGVGGDADPSIGVHAAIAASPCRLAALQIEDALGLTDQVNIPGTTAQYPNWRRRLPVSLEKLAEHPVFRAHTAVMRKARPQ